MNDRDSIMKAERDRKRYQRHCMMSCGNFVIRFVMTVMFAKWSVSYLNSNNGIQYLVILMYFGVYECFTRLYGGFKSGNCSVGEIIIAHALSLGIANAYGWAICSIFFHELLSAYSFLILWVLQISMMSIWAWGMNQIYFHMNIPRNIILISDRNADELLRKINRKKSKFKVMEYCNGQDGWKRLKQVYDRLEGVILYEVASENQSAIMEFCIEKEIRVYLVPTLENIQMRSMRMIHIFDTPMMMYEEFKLHRKTLILKRLCDVLLSAAALVLTSPLFAVIALAIKIEDGGRVFFLQDRCTKDLRVFKMIKFRSMKPGSDQLGAIPVMGQDARITNVGKVIRAARLDELPQLWNILKGDMSLVGPRPERVEYVQEYTRMFPDFALRSKVRGGLTGYAQVYGKYNTSPYDKLMLDLTYIENWNLLLDVKLLFLTVKICLNKESTEGFERESAAYLARQVVEHKNF